MTSASQSQFFTELYPKQEASIIRLLGHPIRLKILVALDKRDCTVKSLWECLGLQQSVVSQHLAKLKNYGVINGKRSGTEMHYTIKHPLVQKIITALGD